MLVLYLLFKSTETVSRTEFFAGPQDKAMNKAQRKYGGQRGAGKGPIP